MPIVAKEPESKFNSAPEGLHQAVCCDVVDLGTEVNKFNGGLQEKVRIVWQIEQTDSDTGKPFQVGQKYTLSLHEKANLRHHLEAWRGRKFTPEELKGFDLEKLIGANCQVQIVHNIVDNGKTYANVQAVVPLGKGMLKMRVTEDYVRQKDRKQAPSTGTPSDSIDDSEVPF